MPGRSRHRHPRARFPTRAKAYEKLWCPSTKKRGLIDLLVDNGLAPTCARAADLIRRGCVSVGGKPQSRSLALWFSPDARAPSARKPAPLSPAAASSSKPRSMPSASTPGLCRARRRRFDRRLHRCPDRPRRGQSLCRRFRAGPFHGKLASTPMRVVAREGIDASALDRSSASRWRAFVADVSFISLALVLPVVLPCGPGGRLVALVKPQCEAGRDAVGKGGIVRDVRPRGDRPSPRCDILSRRRSVGPLSARPPRRFSGCSGNQEFLIGARHGP